MKRIAIVVLGFLPSFGLAQSGIEMMDQRTFHHLMVDEFELNDFSDENDLSWDIDYSVGGDFHRFWAKTEGVRADRPEKRSELQLLYSKSLLPFWNLQAGVRRDLDPSPERDWAVVAIHGLAPRFFEVEAELFYGDGGQSSMRVKGEYELLLTQRLILQPELEFVAYGRDAPGYLIGSGLSEVELGVRLRYEIKREIAPYIGLSWHRLFGRSRDFAVSAGRDANEAVLVAGLRGWF